MPHRSRTLPVASIVVALLVLLSSHGSTPTMSQEPYRQPPPPIAQILDAEPTPLIRLSPDRSRLLFLDRHALPPIAEVAAPELALAGSRINPRTNGPSRSTVSLKGFRLRDVADQGDGIPVETPPGLKLGIPDWSPDGKFIAFSAASDTGITLWVADAATGKARALTNDRLNEASGSGFVWRPDSSGLIAAMTLADRGPAPPDFSTPTGPVVQQSDGKPAPNRTYQDLLTGPTDEARFDYYFSCQLVSVPLHNGEPQPIGPPGIHDGFSPSPSGDYLLVQTIHRPYSYLMPAGRFPVRIEVWDRQGTVVHTLVDRPLPVEIPIAFDATLPGPRSPGWRSDAPATLVWVEALDGGIPANDGPKRDVLRSLPAPFDGNPTDLIAVDFRLGGVTWSTGDLAIVSESWWKTRRQRTWIIHPDDPSVPPRLLFDRSSEDRYSDPGSFLTRATPNGRRLLQRTPDGRAAYLAGAGASPEGDRPFLDRIDLASGTTERLFRSEPPAYEDVVAPLDDQATRLLTRRESVHDVPNYFIRNLADGSLTPITHFQDPAPQLAGLSPELFRYKRADGLELSGKLYLPPGYDPKRDGPLPFVLWAYPREFKSADAASQVTGSPHQFTRPSGISHLFLLTQGYGILDGPAMPIIGQGDAEPNDTYVEQLVAGAQAAVDALVDRGLAQRGRIAVGGHSYGAFMTANLLAHSNLFAAGIARSGAYNRTLTPFGFQAEERTFWEARETYGAMSPFAYADRIKAPLLLIHGQADNNSGTFPIQSERMYAAIRGNGGTARLVLLPAESHGYQARESVGHTLFEMVDWLDRHVKHAGDEATHPPGASAHD
jgi:dipeptidyl aminopeptidase/acylaminoacyl peptidase